MRLNDSFKARIIKKKNEQPADTYVLQKRLDTHSIMLHGGGRGVDT